MPMILRGSGRNAYKVVVSLCDYSGNWARPWNEEGCTCLCYDLKHGDDVTKLHPWTVRQAAADAVREATGDPVYSIVFVLAAPPCTDFAVSGARWWPQKDADGTTDKTLAVLDACVNLATCLSPGAWALENPVGRIPTLRPQYGRPAFYFHPHEYALAADDPASEAYTKKTGIWGPCVDPMKFSGGPCGETWNVEPVMYERGGKRGSWMWANLGGKSERTKTLRSNTPQGFARRFCAANMR